MAVDAEEVAVDAEEVAVGGSDGCNRITILLFPDLRISTKSNSKKATISIIANQQIATNHKNVITNS